ncbi:YczE/YyaS/YitT family protein [Nocardioides sp.]|uniref:membrane protein YczE n=1 Tax=Nocardioides sp. TaxID=35761 RepID=UPI0039E6FEA7
MGTVTQTPLANLGPAEQLRAGRMPRRLAQLLVGLWLYGVSMGLMIRSGLGQVPWDVLHYGLALHLPLSIGQVVVVASFVVLLLWIPLRQAPGLGTILNAVLIGVALDVTLAMVTAPSAVAIRIAFMVVGILGNALATALYIGAQLGPGPRDGLMTGWSRRTGWSLRLVRTSLEVVVVAVGWLLGGVLGVGTVLYAIAIGPLTQHLLPLFTVPLEEREPVSDASR